MENVNVKETKKKLRILFDFDGVIHSYTTLIDEIKNFKPWQKID